ncbi:MAG: bifunctional hydroxymethylpyrimidine kinase/phosphomethylpyrimidine kinase [Bacteroidales bacterium]|nr:bifunctional hydroxymethylpyrimidine kinase/phosphomethylpyrimidine kinase [Bacteroidales bacterium]
MKQIDTRQKEGWKPVCVLSIAGSDSGGGAGLQADLKTVSSLGGFSATAVSAVTVQNTQGVKAVLPVPVETVCAQVEAVCEDLHPDAVKISMLPDAALAAPLAEILKRHACRHIVIDPVMVATSGHTLVEVPGVRSLVEHLFPLAEIVTPNLEEARVLAAGEICDEEACLQAAKKILQSGTEAVLIKGGHAQGEDMKDLLLSQHEPDAPHWFRSPRIHTSNLHGTGCTLSAALAFFLASGYGLEEAVFAAKHYISHAIEAAKDMHLGEGSGPVNHFFAPVACTPPLPKKHAL